MATELVISFPDEPPSTAGENITDLKKHLQMVAPEVEASQERTDTNSQDMGTTLAIILAAPAVVSLAKGIADWLAMRGSKPKVTIRDSKGNTILELDNMPSRDVRILLEGKIGEAVGQ